jgi:valyl-tRNA synthetase
MWAHADYSSEETDRTRRVLMTAGWTVLRLFAPFVPFITEEIYQRYYASLGFKSIHVSPWPTVERLWENLEAEKVGRAMVEVTGYVRRFKTGKKISPAAPIQRLFIQGKQESALLGLKKIERELRHTLRANQVSFEGEGAEPVPTEEGSPFKLWVSIT